MKICFIMNVRLPTEKAHGYQIMKVSERLSKLGEQVLLVVPQRDNPIKKNVFSYYGIENVFDIRRIDVKDTFSRYLPKTISFRIRSFLFFLSLLPFAPDKESIIISRSPEVVWLFALKGYRTFYNAHSWPDSKRFIFKTLLKKIDGIIANSVGTSKEFQKNGFKRVAAIPNGVDVQEFDDISLSKNELREKHGIPINKKIIMYVGHLYYWKGIGTVLEAAKFLEDNREIVFTIVGGTDEDEKKYRSIAKDLKLKNIIFFGHKEKTKIPEFLKSADILLLPNISSTMESELYTSPIKMFEYMASGVPIIASQLPSIQEVLNQKNAILVEANQPKKLAQAILELTPEAGFILAKQAKEDVKKYTWEEHALNIISFLNR